jgi:hypothetical protein
VNDKSDDTQAGPVGGVKPSPRLFQKWSRAQFWRPEEGAALAFGLDPTEVVEARPHDHTRLVAPDPAQHFASLARSSVARGDLEEEAHPADFLEWAESVELAFHDMWTTSINPRVPVGPDGKLENVRETMTRVSKFIEQRDALIEEWALAPSWTLREGACLANNMHPYLLSEHGTLPSKLPGSARVNRLIKFALRAMRQFKLQSDPTPAVFIAWSESVGFPFDAKWIEIVGEPSIDAEPARPSTREPAPTPNSDIDSPSANRTPAQGLGTRPRETMLKLIIGSAIGGYGYDPRMRKSEVPGSIAADLEALGIRVTAETVRKYLDDGAKLLSPDALKNYFKDD